MSQRQPPKQQYCPYCSTARSGHLLQHLDYYTDKYLWGFCVSLGSAVLARIKYSESLLMSIFLEPLSFFKIVEFTSEPDETQFCNRSLIFFKEAKNRGLSIQAVKVLGRHTLIFRLVYRKLSELDSEASEPRSETYYYSGTPLNLKPTNPIIDNKIKVKRFLKQNNIPIAKGGVFTNHKKGFEFGKRLGYPLVIKPNNSSLSHHVTCDINSDEQLNEAIRVAKIYKPDFVVERYIAGNLYRATVIGKKHIFVCQKELANIVGDGISTVEELIKNKNNDPKRGGSRQKNSTLKKIPLNDILIKNLERRRLNLTSIIPAGKKIYLQDKYILSHGCDIINCGSKTDPNNKELFLKIADLLDANLIGIDFICQDISRSYKEQETAILETNSLPYADMHQNPSHGEADNVAGRSWDIVADWLQNV